MQFMSTELEQNSFKNSKKSKKIEYSKAELADCSNESTKSGQSSSHIPSWNMSGSNCDDIDQNIEHWYYK